MTIDIGDARWKLHVAAQSPIFRKGMIAGLQEAACICGQTAPTLAIIERIRELELADGQKGTR